MTMLRGAHAAALAFCSSLAVGLLDPVLAQSAPTPGITSPAPDEIIRGNGRLIGAPPRHPTGNSNEPANITLNFLNADVRDVAKAVLGDYLHLNYEISADAKGTVTIQTSQPLTKSQVMPIFEQVLRLNGMAVVETHGVYRVAPITEVSPEIGALSRAHGGQMGYGIEVVPIHFLSAAEMEKLLKPLAPAQGIVHVDTRVMCSSSKARKRSVKRCSTISRCSTSIGWRECRSRCSTRNTSMPSNWTAN